MLCIVLHYCQSAFEQFWKMRYTKVNLLYYYYYEFGKQYSTITTMTDISYQIPGGSERFLLLIIVVGFGS
jgi:hypothetical protein